MIKALNSKKSTLVLLLIVILLFIFCLVAKLSGHYPKEKISENHPIENSHSLVFPE